MEGTGPTILVAEANPLLSEAVGDLFAEANAGRPVLSAGTIAEALEIAERETPDLVVIDHRMGIGNVEAAVHGLLQRSPLSSVVVLTTRTDESLASRLAAIGVRCVEKASLDGAAHELVESVRRP